MLTMRPAVNPAFERHENDDCLFHNISFGLVCTYSYRFSVWAPYSFKDFPVSPVAKLNGSATDEKLKFAVKLFALAIITKYCESS